MAQNPTPAPSVLDAVGRVSAELRSLIGLLSASPSLSTEAIVAVEAAGRLMDAARVHTVAPLVRNPSAVEKLGFPSAGAAVAALCQISERVARARLTVAAAVSPDRSISGATLPPALPQLGAALDAGQVGLEAAALITRELDAVITRVDTEMVAAAETVMVNLACGFDPTGSAAVVPVSVDYLTAELRQIGAAIDPDGARPREERAARRRSLRIGAQDEDGLFPVAGRLQPQIGLLLAGMVEAQRRSPRFVDASELETPEGITSGDSRTPDQRRHDAFAEVLMMAAASTDAPQLDGGAVTVLVTVDAEQLADPDGRAGEPIGSMAGSKFPLSRAEVDRFIDANGFRKVAKNAGGAVVGISSPERCFTNKMRLSIAARDGCQCSRPGCSKPPYTLQVHHVIPWRDGGPTTTDNGILLCYWCHQQVDTGPWQYRMVGGLPEVRGPGIPDWTRLRPGTARAA